MSTPVLIPGQFRSDFPEFADSTQYSDGMINFYLTQSVAQLDATRWGALFVNGQELFIAHHLVLRKMALDTAASGGWPGMNKGVISAESAGDTSLNYDQQATAEADAGHWAKTDYGLEFARLAKQIGAGAFQTGACSGIQSNIFSGGFGFFF